MIFRMSNHHPINFVVIVAGGSGNRMKNSLPKQFHLLDRLPVLMRTIHAFHRANAKPEIVVVLPSDWITYWTDLCYKFQFHVPHFIAEGGNTRFQSVKMGLDFISTQRLSGESQKLRDDSQIPAVIAVHDGARPLVSPALIDDSFEMARSKKAVIPAIESTDSVRFSENGTNKVLPRNQVFLIQTPQTFHADILFKAYEQEESPTFTDDATVVESIGETITLIEGDKTNLKITTEDDLAFASALLQV